MLLIKTMATTTLRRLHATVGQMQKNLECSICLDLLRDPVSTKCDHQFCRFCIHSLLMARKKPSAPCPLCKELITKRSLTKNERMNEIVTAVRGVVNAIEIDTGIRCTPPKGPPQLSQSSGSATDALNEDNVHNKQVTGKLKKNKQSSGTRRNVHHTHMQQPVQQVNVYIDSDHSDSEGHEIQLPITNTNISSSFPVPTRSKGKKGRKQPRKCNRTYHENHNVSDDVRDSVSSNNAHNTMLNALSSKEVGGKMIHEGVNRKIESMQITSISEAKDSSSKWEGLDDNKRDVSSNQEGNLLEVLDHGSLGLWKETTERMTEGSVNACDENSSLPGNTELVAEIFGLPASSQNKDISQNDVIVLKDHEEFIEKPPITLEVQVTESKLVNQEDVSEKKTEVNLDKRTAICNEKENSGLTENDPYEFIPSQRTPRKVRSKAGKKKKTIAQNTRGVSSGKLTKFKKKLPASSQLIGTQRATNVNLLAGLCDQTEPSLSSVHKRTCQKDTSSQDIRNQKVQNLFVSEANNDSHEDRLLPLFDYEDSSDEESLPCSDESYKSSCRGLRQQENKRSITRQSKQNKAKTVGKRNIDADDSSTSIGKTIGLRSRSKRKIAKPAERRSARRNKKATSDLSSSKECLENSGAELEVSYIQEHLKECDDVVLHLDGDSQKQHNDIKVNKQVVNRDLATKRIDDSHNQVSVVEINKNCEKKQLTRSNDEIEPRPPGSKKKKENLSQNDAEDEAVMIEDSEPHLSKTAQKLIAHVDEISDPFKKPLTDAFNKNKMDQKSKQDWLTITKTSSMKKAEMDLKPDSFKHTDNNKERQYHDSDEDELTLVDSQRERKKRSPGGVRVFFSAYKRGSIHLAKGPLQENSLDNDDDHITLADVFGDNTVDDNQHIDKALVSDGLDEVDEIIDLAISDKQEKSVRYEDVIVVNEPNYDVSTRNNSNVNELSTVKPYLHLPIKKSNDQVITQDDDKRRIRKSSRERKEYSKSEDILVQDQSNTNEQILPANNSKVSRTIPQKQTQSQLKYNVTKRGSWYPAKKLVVVEKQLEDFSETTGKSGVQQTAGKNVTSTRKQSRDEKEANKTSVAVVMNMSANIPSEREVIPTKSDWEIALELAREFDTEPRQFRLRGGQRLSDEIANNKSSRGSGRKKTELHVSTISATQYTKDLPSDKHSQSEVEDVEEINTFSTEDTDSIKLAVNEGKCNKQWLKDVDSDVHTSNKKKISKKMMPHSKKAFPNQKPHAKWAVTDKQLSKLSPQPEITDFFKEKEKSSIQKKSPQLKDPMLPDVTLTESVDGNFTGERGETKRRYLRRRGSLLTTEKGKDSLPLSEGAEPSCQKILNVNILAQKSPRIIPQTPFLDSVTVNNAELVSSLTPNVSSNTTNDTSYDDDVPDKNHLKVKGGDNEHYPLNGRCTRNSVRRAKACQSGEIDSSRSRVRIPFTKCRQLCEISKSCDAEVTSNANLKYSKGMLSKISNIEGKEESQSCSTNKIQQQDIRIKTNIDNFTNRNKNITLQQQQLCNDTDKNNRCPSRNRVLRSGRRPRNQLSSGAESSDQDNSTSRERGVKSQKQLGSKNKTLYSANDLLRRSARGKGKLQPSDAESTNLASSKTLKKEFKEICSPPAGEKQSRSKNSATDTLQKKDRYGCMREASSDIESLTTPEETSSTSLHSHLPRKSPRLSSLSPSSVSKHKGKPGQSNLQSKHCASGILFSEEDSLYKKENTTNLSKVMDAGKSSDTTESIELEVSNEEYEQENPDVQLQSMQQDKQKGDLCPPAIMSNIDHHVTKRNTKLSRNRKQRSDKISMMRTESLASGTETESISTISDTDETNNTNTGKHIFQKEKKSPRVDCEQKQKLMVAKKEIPQNNVAGKQEKSQRFSGSETESLCSSGQGSDSDIFRCSDLSPRRVLSGSSEKIKSSDKEDVVINVENQKVLDLQECEQIKTVNDCSKVKNTCSHLVSVDSAALGSSLESEPLLVPPPRHYQENFISEKILDENVKAFTCEKANEHVDKSQKNEKISERRRSKRKSFALGTSPDSEKQQYKKQKNGETDNETVTDNYKSEENSSIVLRRSGRRTSQQSQKELASSLKEMVTSPLNVESNGRQSQKQQEVVNLVSDEKCTEFDFLYTKRRSRTSGSRHSSYTNSPRNVSTSLSIDSALPSEIATDGMKQLGKVERGVNLSQSQKQNESQILSGNSAIPNNEFVTSPRRSLRKRHSSNTGRVTQQVEIASRDKSLTPLDNDDIVNSGSLFGTPYASQHDLNQKSREQKNISSINYSSTSSQHNSLLDEFPDVTEGFKVSGDKEIISGSQCMFSSDPGSSSEQDVEMITEESDGDDSQGEVQQGYLDACVQDSTHPKHMQALYLEEKKSENDAPRLVTTIPESVDSTYGMSKQAVFVGRSSKTNQFHNSNERNSNDSGKKYRSSGSTSTYVPASENASVSPDRLSEPIPMRKRLSEPIPLGKRLSEPILTGEREMTCVVNNRNQSKSDQSKHHLKSNAQCKKSAEDNVSKQNNQNKQFCEDTSLNIAKETVCIKKDKKMIALKLSDINLSENDVDGDHDLLFEEQEDGLTSSPMVSSEKCDKTSNFKIKETDVGEYHSQRNSNNACHTECLFPKTACTCRHSKDGISAEENENISGKDEVMDKKKEVIGTRYSQKTQANLNKEEKIVNEEESDGEAMEVESVDSLGCEVMEEMKSQEEIKTHNFVENVRVHVNEIGETDKEDEECFGELNTENTVRGLDLKRTYHKRDINDIPPDVDDSSDNEFENIAEEEDEDDFIPPTPPCANTTASLSKSHLNSKSFLNSFQFQSTKRGGTQNNTGSSSSFSSQPINSFVFKHPSTTHTQRNAKVKNLCRGDSTISSKELPHENNVQNVLCKQSSGNIEVSNEDPSLEESLSLSLFHGAAETIMDFNVLPENLADNPRKHSQKSKVQTGRETALKYISDEEEKQDHVMCGQNKDKRRNSGVLNHHKDNQDDELIPCSFLHLQKESTTDNEPTMNEEDQVHVDKIDGGKNCKRNDNHESKSSTVDEKEYDTEASVCSEDSNTSHHLNLTSASSVMSSQSELISTQQQHKIQETLKKMQLEIAQMEATLAKDDKTVNPQVLANDSDGSQSDSNSDNLETELDSRIPRGADNDAFHCDQDEKEIHDNVQGLTSQRRYSKSSNTHVNHINSSRQRVLSSTKSRRSQRLVFSDEEESDNDTGLNRNPKPDVDVDFGSRHNSFSQESLSNHNDSDVEDDEPLGIFPKSPSPPPPLTQGKWQKYSSSRTPLPETLQNVTKLADQYKSGSKGDAVCKKRLVSRSQRKDSNSSDDASANVLHRSRKRHVSKKVVKRRGSPHEDEDIRLELQRNAKRRHKGSDFSSDEEPVSLNKCARSSRTSTPRNSGSGVTLFTETETRRHGTSKTNLIDINISQDQSLDSDITQMTKVGGNNQQNSRKVMKSRKQRSLTKAFNSTGTMPELSPKNSPTGNQRSSLKKVAESPRALLNMSSRVIENSLPELSRKSLTPNSSKQRDSATKSVTKDTAVCKTPPGSISRLVNQGSFIMEFSCQRTLLQEDCAPVVAKNLRKNNGKFSFVATGLSRLELREVERLAKLTGCKFASTFNANTTHVIINTDEDLVCERTLKYFQGVAARVWVVSYTWVDACLKTNDLLPEEGFEVQGDVVNGRSHSGPEKARTWKGKPLMRNYEICSVGPFTGLNKDQLVSLLELCGSTTVQHPTLFPFDAGHQFYVVVQQNCHHTQQDYDALYKKYRVPIISREWVLDCVATYSLQLVDDYLLSGAGDLQPIVDLDSDVE